jgi:hypothetical protein
MFLAHGGSIAPSDLFAAGPSAQAWTVPAPQATGLRAGGYVPGTDALLSAAFKG